MFRDARGVLDGSALNADLCVIGGGAAGITLALGVKEAGFSTIMLEAGGFERDPENQSVYSGGGRQRCVPGAVLADLTASTVRRHDQSLGWSFRRH